MTTRILKAIESYLRPIVAAQGGTVHLSGTPAQTLELLSQAPGAWRCIVQWQGEDPVGNVTRSAQRMAVLFILQESMGLPLAASMAPEAAGDNPELQLLQRMEFVTHHLRAMQLQGNVDNQFPAPRRNARFYLEQASDKAQPLLKGIMFTFDFEYGQPGVNRVIVPV